MKTKVLSLLLPGLLAASAGACGGGGGGGEAQRASLPRSIAWQNRDLAAGLWPETAQRVQVLLRPTRFRGTYLAYVVTDGSRIVNSVCVAGKNLNEFSSDVVARATRLPAHPRVSLWYDGTSPGARASLPPPPTLYASQGDTDPDDGDDGCGIVIKETSGGGTGPTRPPPDEYLRPEVLLRWAKLVDNLQVKQVLLKR